MELSSAAFSDFFRAIHGYDPFPWQRELVRRLAGDDDRWPVDEWPDVLDLPTGSGKTAAMDAAVFHLALRFNCPQRAALRIALVVDRRLVVDDAHERAKKIAHFLDHPEMTSDPGRAVVAEVASRLRYLAGARESDTTPPLVAQRLRGGAPLESDWARTPTQPTILCSTVDQVGSRLLFRGYGVSNRMKPVHAGLLGKHTLILLDEAHLSEPFRETVEAVRNLGDADVKTVLLSATPGGGAARPHKLTSEDYDNSVLRQRLEAAKHAHLHVVSRNLANALTSTARDTASRLRQDGVSAPVVGVVVNRVGLARETFNLLRERNASDSSDSILLIGRSRGVERDRIAHRLAPFRTGSQSRTPVTFLSDGGVREDDAAPSLDATGEDRLPLFRQEPHIATSTTGPLFVVATQCLEVGVDLDLDGLVTQAASFDALRQRFGRLNRAGRPIRAAGAVLTLREDVKKRADDPIYGDRIVKTWAVLEQIADGGVVDFGIAAMARQLEANDVDVVEVAAPRDNAPVMMPAYLDLWSQTSPPPAADPDVGLFLHGVERGSVGVSLVWRSDVTRADLMQGIDLASVLQWVPPRAGEMIEVPLWSARAWLTHSQNGESLADVSDVPERAHDHETARGSASCLAYRWAGTGDPRTGLVSNPRDLRPGDVLVLPAEYGGCDLFGWDPTYNEYVSDVADEVARPFRRRRHAVRLARDVVATDAQWERLRGVLHDDGLTEKERIDRLLDVLVSASGEREEADVRRPILDSLDALRRAKGEVRQIPYPGEEAGRSILLAPHGLSQEQESGETIRFAAGSSTDDDTLSHTSRRPVSIDEHTNNVIQRVAGFVDALDCSDAVRSDLELAARLHDAGKADHRFQRYLAGGDPWNRPDGPAMAKSGRQSSKGAWVRAGLPNGWRHEALSVRMARVHPNFSDACDPDLVLWLIGTHHGLGRPFFDFADPDGDGSLHQDQAACLEVDRWDMAPGPGPQSMAFDLDGDDWASLYQRLRQRYGVWELAHLEAVLRLADHRASEAEQQ